MKAYNPGSQSNIVPFNSRALDSSISSQIDRAKTWRSKHFNAIWQAFVTMMTPSNEPKIYQKRDRHGNSYFHVYDPVTGLSSTFGDEQEIRGWLDQRYHQ